MPINKKHFIEFYALYYRFSGPDSGQIKFLKKKRGQGFFFQIHIQSLQKGDMIITLLCYYVQIKLKINIQKHLM